MLSAVCTLLTADQLLLVFIEFSMNEVVLEVTNFIGSHQPQDKLHNCITYSHSLDSSKSCYVGGELAKHIS